MNKPRQNLDQLFALDAILSVIFGSLALLAPHGVLTFLSGGFYNHSVHETLRSVTAHRSCMFVADSMEKIDLRHVIAVAE